jgi:hypothetical protein
VTARNGRGHRRGVASPGSLAAKPRLLATVLSNQSLSRCVPIALLVGTLLSLINQGTVILGGQASEATWVRVALNYVVPFCVSSAGFFASQRSVWVSDKAVPSPSERSGDKSPGNSTP